MRGAFALVISLMIVSTLQANVPGFWSGYRIFQNNGSTTYSQTITFSNSTVNPADYEAFCSIHSFTDFESSSGLNFNCDCQKQVSAVYCTLIVGSSMDWTEATVNIAVSARPDIRLGTFSRIYNSSQLSSIAQVLSHSWNGTNNQSLIYAQAFIRGVSTTASNWGIGVSNSYYNLSTNQISFNLSLNGLSSSNIEVYYSYVIMEATANYTVEEDLDVATIDTSVQELNGYLTLDMNTTTGSLTASFNGFNQADSYGFVLFNNDGFNLGYPFLQNGCLKKARIIPFPISTSNQKRYLQGLSAAKLAVSTVKKLSNACAPNPASSSNSAIINPFGLN